MYQNKISLNPQNTFSFMRVFTVFEKLMEGLISANDPDLSRGITLAAFQSVGIVPFLRDKLIIWVKGLAITLAAFFNIPRRKFSRPEELFRLRFFSSLMISPSGITLNSEFSCVGWMLHMTGLFQTRSQSGMNVFFKVRTSSVKKLQIVLGMIPLSVIFGQGLGWTQRPFRALWEFFLKVVQSLSGKATFSSRRSRCDLFYISWSYH